MSNFLIEITRNTYSDRRDPLEGSPIIASIYTDSILEFTEFMSSSIEYFSSEVRFNSDIEFVSIMVRTYRDHHNVTITRLATGVVQIRTNQ